MGVTFVAAGTPASGSGVDLTPALPAGFQAGDLLLCAAYTRSTPTIATPSGWTSRYQESNGGAGTLALFYKIAAGGDADPLVDASGTWNAIIAQCAALRGVDQATPFGADGTTYIDGAATDNVLGPIGAASTTGIDDGAVIVLGGWQNDWTSANTLSGDGLTWTEIGEPDTTAGIDAAMVWDFAPWSGGAPTLTAKTFSLVGATANNGAIGRMTVLRAAAGGQTLNVPRAQLALAGKDVAVNARSVLPIGEAALGPTGRAVTVNARTLLGIGKAALGFTGRAVQVGVGETLAVGKAALAWTGRSLIIVEGGNAVAVPKGAWALTGRAVVINARAALEIPKGAFAFKGRAIRIPDAFRRALFAPQTGAAVLVLLTIEHEQIEPPLRFTSDSVNTLSLGETYLAYPFELTLPRRDSQRPALSRIRIDNVSREIVEKLRAATGPATITAEIVMSSSPDRVEFGPWAWKLRNASADFFVVEGELEFGSKLLRAWPKQRFTPRTHPGLF